MHVVCGVLGAVWCVAVVICCVLVIACCVVFVVY